MSAAGFRVAFISSTGGAGRTSLTAALARQLQPTRPVVAVDFDPQNFLGVCLGTVHPPQQGLVSAAGTEHSDALRMTPALQLLAFGACDAQQRTAFERTLAAEPRWLERRLRAIEMPAPTMVLIDAARSPSVYAEQAVAAADLVVAVLCCDVASLVGVDALLAIGAGRRMVYLINQLDPTRRLQQDIHTLLQARLKPFQQFLVHRDEALPQALAGNRALIDQAPTSQAAQDIQALAAWLLVHASPP